MAFDKSYSGDSQTLAIIAQTIQAKTAVVPGVTVKAELAGLVNAEVASFYYDLAPNVTTGTAGRDFSVAGVGNKKATITLNQSYQIDEKIPGVAIANIGANVVQDKVAKGSLALANKFGNGFIGALVAKGQAQTYTKDLGAYDAIIDAIGKFAQTAALRVGSTAVADYVVPTVATLPTASGGAETGKTAIVLATGKHYTASSSAWAETSTQPAMYFNADNGIQPTAIIVGDKFRKELMSDSAYKNLITATGQLGGLMPDIAGGIRVVYAQDLDKQSSAPEFVMLYGEGIAYPFSFNALRVVDAEGFVGVRVQGEVAYSANADDMIAISSHCLKFTEVLA